jgi:hypothetical protein
MVREMIQKTLDCVRLSGRISLALFGKARKEFMPMWVLPIINGVYIIMTRMTNMMNPDIGFFHDDFCTIRRDMVAEGILERKDGAYTITEILK